MTVGDTPLAETAERPVGLEAAFHDAMTGMAILDLEGRFRLVNPAFCRLVGRSEDELVGLKPVDVTHPEDRSVSVSTLESLLSGGAQSDQRRKRYVRPDGTVLTVQRTTTVMRSGGGEIVGLFSQVLDVSEAVATEEALRKSEKRFRALVAHASDLTVLLDGSGTILYASPASTALLGYPPETVEGRSAFEFLHPEDLELASANFALRLATPGVTAPAEYRVRHRDGSFRHAEIVVTNRFADPDVGALVLNIRDVSEARDAERQLAASEQRLRALVSGSWDVITLHDAEGRYLYCSPAVTTMLGWHPDELLNTDALSLIHPDDVSAAESFWKLIGESEPGRVLEYRYRHRNGSWRWLESTAHNRLDDPAVAGVVVTSRDVSNRRRRAAQQDAVAVLSREALRGGPVEGLFTRAVNLVATVLEVEHCTVLRLEGDDRLNVVVRFGSPLVEGTFAAEVGGRPVSLAARALRERRSVVWGSDDRDPGANCYPRLSHLGITSGAATTIGDGNDLFGALAVYSTQPDAFSRDEVSFLEATANVLAAAIGRRRVEQELRQQALHDNLTGLPNRILLFDRLTAALARLDRHGGSVAVLFIDTDDFKLVNDSLGHAAGDQIVSAVAERIAGELRRSDLVARFGGDEFIVLCEDTDREAAERVVARIRQALAAPIGLGDRHVVVTVSIGIAIASSAGLTPDDVLAQADTAMYSAKQAGKDRAAVFDLRMRQEVTAQLDTASGLRRALAGDELRLFYQPVVDSESGSVVGAEALLRWQHPTEGLLGPDRFVAYAESSGLIVPIGGWVLETACRQAAAFAAAGFPGSMSINVSSRQLVEVDLVAEVVDALEQSGASPAAIALEVTESAVMTDVDRAARVLEELRGLGVNVGMDDFGTGHSSLSYLASLPLDFVKIDRSFIARFDEDRRAAALLQTIAALCRTLELAVIVEGVETERQRDEVRRLNIPYIQGFLFGRPVPAESFPLPAVTADATSR